MHRTVVEADVDGRAFSTMSKGELRALAKQAALTSASRNRLYAAVGALKGGDAGGEWIALHGSETNPQAVGIVDAGARLGSCVLLSVFRSNLLRM